MCNVAIFGCGQRAREIRCLLEIEQNIKSDFYIVDKEYIQSDYIDNCKVISTEQFCDNFSPNQIKLYLGVGMPSMNKIRERLYNHFHNFGFSFETFISKYANVYTDEIGEGTTVFAGVNIGPHVRIGCCNHFEMGVTISHDCRIGDFNFFAPGCTLCGDITIGTGNFIGANSTVRNSVAISDYVLVGAGAYIDKNVSTDQVIVPPRSILLADKTSKDFMK